MSSLDDIAIAISDLATNIDERFDAVDRRFDGIDKRLDAMDGRMDSMGGRISKLEDTTNNILHEQRQIKEWMERLDNRLSGVESDIKEIYDRLVALEKKAPNLTKADVKEMQDKFEVLFKWAKQVSAKTGVALPKV